MEPRISALLGDSLTGATDHFLFESSASLPHTTVTSQNVEAPIHTSHPASSLQYLISPLAWDSNEITKNTNNAYHVHHLPTLIGEDRLRLESDHGKGEKEKRSGGSTGAGVGVGTDAGGGGGPVGGVKNIKSSVPLAEVLNKKPSNSPARNGVALSKILRRPSEQDESGNGERQNSPRKRKREPPVQAQDFLTLPRPQPPARKNVKRQRIPPLLQGLHQPPPDAGLFPPITAEAFKGKQSEDPRKGQQRSTSIERKTQPEISQVDDSALVSVSVSAPASNLTTKSTSSNEKQAKDGGKSRQAGVSEKTSIQDSSSKKEDNNPSNTPVKQAKKRKKWSEKETSDLLQGVARFGIGRWKKILADPSYKFEGRTPVDLKDRFRTCCPDEYRKFSNQPNEKIKSSKSGVGRGKGAPSHRKTASDLAELGINGPFRKSDRRSRREFSAAEDEALLAGYEKHGSLWQIILKEAGQVLEGRNPTDLRDRFRNAFPDRYEKAGYVVKSKKRTKSRDESMEQNSTPEKSSGTQKERTQSRPTSPVSSTPSKSVSKAVPAASAASATTVVSSVSSSSVPSTSTHPISFASSASSATAVPSLKPLHLNFMNPLDWIGDEFAVSDDEGASPIQLDRSIFDWANMQNPSIGNSLPHHQSSRSSNTNIRTLTTTGSIHTTLPSMITSYQEHVNPLDTVSFGPSRNALPSAHTFATVPNGSSSTSVTGEGNSLAPISSHLATTNLPSLSLSSRSTLLNDRRNVKTLNLPRPSDLF